MTCTKVRSYLTDNTRGGRGCQAQPCPLDPVNRAGVVQLPLYSLVHPVLGFLMTPGQDFGSGRRED